MLKNELLTFFISMLPVFELRGAIPFAISCGISPWAAYLISVAGNILPVFPLLLLLKELFFFISHYSWGERVLKWLLKMGEKRKGLIERYSLPGLVLLVAIPLPITGAWTGVLVSFLLSLKIRYALLAISIGVCLAGAIVLLASLGAISGIKYFIGM